jgi:hypothetical protein
VKNSKSHIFSSLDKSFKGPDAWPIQIRKECFLKI